MSHFVGLCFGSNVSSMLERYDENLEVASYIRHTKEEAIDLAKSKHVKKYELALENINNANEDRKEYYQKIIDEGQSLSDEKAWEIAKNWGYEIDEDENLLSTYNLDSKWDWWTIGGRWDGFLVLKERDINNDIVKTNTASFEDIDWDYMIANNVPFCYIDEYGEWFEKGKMGWWAMVDDEKEDSEWINQFEDFIDFIDTNPLVTVIDFHI